MCGFAGWKMVFPSDCILVFYIAFCFFLDGCGVSHLSCHYYSQKKVENVDLIVQNKLCISDECRKSFGGFHSSFTVSSVIFFRQ